MSSRAEKESGASSATIEAGSRTATSAKSPQTNRISSGRESVESFVFVFLFFLVLGVEAEGFVIPTGSMAPTLMGRHKEVTCPDCGFVYAVNADRELNDAIPQRAGAKLVESGTCVNCRFMAEIADEPNFQGDRIYVMKTPLDIPFLPALGQVTLGRWDIAVFKLPEEPEIRYIKRMVGMPNEVVRILRGDIWIRPLNSSEPFHRAPRALKHQEAMQQLVYDDAYRPKSLADDRRWQRWGGDAWNESAAERGTFRVSAQADWAELRYSHMVPDPVQRAQIAENRPLSHPPRATLITDFCPYNTDLTAEGRTHPRAAEKAWRQPHWVGDLTIKFNLDVEERAGKARIELIKAGVSNRCEIDLATGNAMLFHGSEALGSGARATGIIGRDRYAISFANVDGRLTLRVNGQMPFGEGLIYDEGPAEPIAPTAADLSPIGIAVQGCSAAVSGLVVTRDIYYTFDPMRRADYDGIDLEDPLPTDPVAFFDWLADPKKFAGFAQLLPNDFAIGPGRYMMLGDNSPASRDGRAWERHDQVVQGGWDNSGRESWEVPESLLIGKAFCVYWPHLKPVWPAIKVTKDIRLPAIPNFMQMRWIR